MKRFSSPFGVVELTSERHSHVLKYHPDVREHLEKIAVTLSKPDFIKPSIRDREVMLFYHNIDPRKYLVVVVKFNKRNFILTTYLTIKQ